jgi:hypothetical protein
MLAIGAVMFVPTPVFAQTSPCNTTAVGQDCAQQGLKDIGDAFPGGAKTNKSVPDIVHLIINWALYIAAILAVIFIIYGGFLYITSAGDTAQSGKGRTALTNALIGLAIVILSYLIVQIVYNFLTVR